MCCEMIAAVGRKTLWRTILSMMVFFGITTAHAATLHNPSYDWFTLQSEHFYIHYHEGLEDIAREMLSIAEQVHKKLSKQVDWNPTSRTHVVLTDEYDFSNGFAIPFPFNFTTLFITPPDDLLSLEDHAGWLETVFTHEYTHVLHLDKVDGIPASLRDVLGRHFLTFPNLYEPRWLIEGYATYSETDRKRGIGRGQSSLYEAMMRAELLGGFKPLKQVNQPMATWPGGTAAYLYGVFWYEFIEHTYGRQQVEMAITHHSDNLLPFSINRTAESTYGKDLSQLWDDFEVYLQKRFAPQFERIRQQGVVEGQRLTHVGYYNGPIRTLPNGEAYYISYDGERDPSLMKIDKDQHIERLTDVHFGARLDVHPKAGVLLAQLEICGAGQAYMDIYRMDLDGDDLQRLTKCGRYRNAIWSPDGKQIIGVKYARGVTSLHLLDDQGKLKRVLWTGKRWEVIGGLDWSPVKNELTAAVWREQGGWNLESFNLDTGQWHYVLKDSAIVGYPQYTDDGRYLLFTSEHGGVYNIRRMDTRTGKIVTLTNVLTGALSPAQTPAGDLYYVGYTSDGLDIYYLPAAQMHPGPLPKAAPGPTGIPAPKPPVVEPQAITEYSPWDTLAPSWWTPYIFSDSGRSELGVATAAYDSLLQHIYAAMIAYDRTNHWWLGELSYIYDGWYPTVVFDVARGHEFSYDQNSNKTKVRQTTDQMLEMMFPFRSIDSSWSFNLAVIKHEEEDVQRFTGAVAEPKQVDNVAGAAVVYDSAKRHIKSVSRSQGRMISLVAEDSDAISGSDYAGQVYWGDWREFMRLGGEHVLAMRYVEGRGTDTTRPFKLGGSINGENLSSSVNDPVFGSPFKKRDYNLRGYPEGLAQLQGQNMRLGSAEYRFPLARVERGQMAPPLGLDQVHAALFYDIGATWDKGTEPEHYYRGYGVELNFDTVFFYYATVQLSLGFAKGIDEGGERQMYIRVGAAF